MSYKEHAMLEFKAAGWLNSDGTFKDEMQKAICEDTLSLLEVFSQQGHSGGSAPYAIKLFKTLASKRPITPLTGEDWEWSECTSMGQGKGFNDVFQNKRCSHVFKQAGRFNGQAYDLNAIVFYDETIDADGAQSKSYFTNGESARAVEFPYTPKTEYVKSES